MYITQTALNRCAPESALLPLLNPVDPDSAFDANRRLMWTLFPGEQPRDFIWRADGNGKFIIVSKREPQESRLFDPLDTKEYIVNLREGDNLDFILRVNATRDLVDAGRVDIVMNAMWQSDGVNVNRAEQRMEYATKAAKEWLDEQGDKRGFRLTALAVDDYSVRKVARGRNKEATFGILDVRGRLMVTEPKLFTRTLYDGIGRAKGFGCGLMLVRRV